MPYLSFDFDALERVPDAAATAGISPGDMTYGLLRLWRLCWREKIDTVGASHLSGFFPGAPIERLAKALTTFRFAESAGDDSFRVKGADRYLRIRKAQSDGGKMSAKNLNRGPKKTREAAGGEPGQSRKSTPAIAGGLLQLPPGSAPALTANSEQRAADLFSVTADAAPVKQSKPADPRHAPLVRQMSDAFTELVGGKWDFDGRQAKAVTALLEKGEPPEVLARWRRSLVSQFYGCRYPHELVAKWAHHGGDSTEKPKNTVQPPAQQCEVWK